MGARRYELEVRQHLNGPKKYCVPGREPDTADNDVIEWLVFGATHFGC